MKNTKSITGLILFISLDASPIKTGMQNTIHDNPTVNPRVNPSIKYFSKDI